MSDEFWRAIGTLISLRSKTPPLRGRDRTSDSATSEAAPSTAGQPLSRSQARLLLLDGLRDDPAAYNLSYRLELEGALDIANLERAFQAVVDKHEILRTTYNNDEQLPTQHARATTLAFQSEDIRGRADSESIIETALQQTAARPFDLSAESPLRLHLLRTGDTQYALLVCVHHIAFDFDSLDLFLHDLSTAYDLLQSNPASKLPALPAQYVDFARWQQEALTDGEYKQKLIEFWQRELEGGVAGPDAFVSQTSPANERAGRSIAVELPADLSKRVRDFSREEGGTLFSTCLAAFHLLFYEPEQASSEDFFVCCPSSGRSHDALSRAIGYFVNPLVLRAKADGNPSFREFLARTRDSVTRAFAHQDLPIEEVDALGLLKTPVARSMFALLKTPRLPAPDGIRIEVKNLGELYGAAADFTMYFYLMETDRGLTGRFLYDASCLSDDDARRLVERYREILEAALAQPEASILHLPRLAAHERGARMSTPTKTSRAPATPALASTPAPAPAPGHPDLRSYLHRTIAEILNIDADQLPFDRSLFAVRFDSLAAIRLRNRLTRDLNIDLRLAKILNGPSIDQLTATLNHSTPTEPIESAAQPRTNRFISPGQEALWLVHRQDPTSDAYNVAYSARLPARLDTGRLRRAIESAVQRHECLRMTFPVDAESAEARLHPTARFDFEERDASGWSRTRLYRELLATHRRPYDLTNGPLIRVLTLKRSDSEHYLFIGVHHIAIDYISLDFLVKDIEQAYTADAHLPAADRSYADYIRDCQAALQAPSAARALRYWTRVLADPPPPPRLPFAAETNGPARLRGATVRFRIPDNRVANASRAFSSSPYTICLSALYALLHRYTAHEDILIGSPATGRDRPEDEKLVGYLVNPIVIRANVDAQDSFTTLLERVNAAVSGALDHRSYPFSRLVQRLAPDRQSIRTPFFQILFNYLNATDTPASSALPLERFELPQTEGQFDLSFELTGKPGFIEGALKFNSDLFDRRNARAVTRHYAALLEQVLAHPDRPISELALLDETERARQIARIAAQDADESHLREGDVPAAHTIHGFFEGQARRHPQRTALVHGTQKLTYRQLNDRAENVAQALRQSGVGPEERVGILLDRDPGMIVAMLGVLKTGGAYVPLDPGYPDERIDFMLHDSAVRVLLTGRALEQKSQEQEQTTDSRENSSYTKLYIEDIPEAAPHDSADKSNNQSTFTSSNQAEADNLAYVIYTSGSTGRPKGVAIEHRSAVELIRWTFAAYDAQDFTGTLASTSFCFDLSVFEIFVTLAQGGRIILARNALDWPSLPAREEVSLVNTVPSAMTELVRLGLPGRPRVVNLAGEALATELVNQIHRQLDSVRVYDLYGPSEDTTYSTRALREVDAPPTIGRPIQGTRAYVLDAGRNPTPPEVPGELYLAGKGLARGYLNRPELTVERFPIDTITSAPGERMYRTGDIVSRSRSGELRFHGRADQQVKTRGYRVEPGEIEAALKEHPAIYETAVIKHPAADELVAYYSLHPEYEIKASSNQSEAAEKQERDWRAVWEQTYADGGSDPRFDITGWKDSTGRAIPAHEMREWVDETILHIQASTGRQNQGDVLEIGCGTGLLLFRLLEACDSYTATDFSGEVIERLGGVLTSSEREKVNLVKQSADDFSALAGRSFDLIILNSVIQYFPSESYLHQVLSDAARHLKPGGLLYLGDLRSLALREQQNTAERELLIDPAYFYAPARSIKGIQAADVFLKQGTARNELTRTRYQAVLRAAPGARFEVKTWLDWNAEELDLVTLRARLRNHRDLGLEAIPNARLQSDGVDPEALRRLGQELGFNTFFSWARQDESGAFDLVFYSQTQIQWPRYPQPQSRANRPLHNNPLRDSFLPELERELREALKQSLPDFMRPGRFVHLERLPRTPNGKLNPAALPAPDLERDRPVLETEYTAPENEIETTVANIWREMLQVERIGKHDNFFDLGGHSLLLVKIGARLQSVLGRKISPTDLFKYPTIKTLVDFLDPETDANGTKPGTKPGTKEATPGSQQAAVNIETDSTPEPQEQRPATATVKPSDQSSRSVDTSVSPRDTRRAARRRR